MTSSKKNKRAAERAANEVKVPSLETQPLETEVPWTRLAIYETALCALLVVWASTSPMLKQFPYALPLVGLTGLAALACVNVVYPKDPQRAHELALANGLAALILIRPWIDGITFPQYNVHFFWFAAFLFLILAAKAIFDGDVFVRSRLQLVNVGFLIVTALGLTWSIQYDSSYRGWVNWLGFVFLFVAASHTCRSRVPFGIVIAAFLCAGLAESIYAVWHIKYQIPQIRAVVERSPEILLQQAGRTANRDELMHRLYTNRAFGTFLFANALAAFLILVIPLGFAVAVDRWMTLRAWLKTRFQSESLAPVTQRTTFGSKTFLSKTAEDAGAGALLTWLATMAISVGVVFLFLVQVGPQYQSATTRIMTWLIPGIVPVLCALIAFVIIRRIGLGVFWLFAQGLFAALCAVVSSYALVLTVSRGGMLALTISTLVTAALLGMMTRGRMPGFLKKLAVLVFILSIFGIGFTSGSISNHRAWAVDSPGESSAPETVSQSQIGVEGRAISPAELLSPLTFTLRVGYWRVALYVLKDYWLRGVGLNNFGVIYARYQFLGAGDVKQAHNDYLQVFCETGIFGVILFCSFWAGVLYYGVRLVIRGASWGDRILSAGIFAGVLAFLLHSLVDFNFYNPSLATFQYILAGVLIARGETVEAGQLQSRSSSVVVRRVIWFAAMLLAVMVAFSARHLRAVDQLIGDPGTMSARLNVADFILRTCNPDAEKGPDRRIPYRAIKALVNSDAVAARFGKVVGPPAPVAAVVPSRQGKPVTTGLEEFIITDKAVAYETAQKAVDFWIEKSKRVDRLYPYSPDLATQIFQWYDLLASLEKNSTGRLAQLEHCLFWAREIVKRSPLQAVNYELLGRILWLRAGLEQSPRRPELYREGIEAYRRSAELYPTSKEIWTRYGQRVLQYGKALQESQDPVQQAEAPKFIEEGERALKYAETLPARQ